MSKWTNPEEWRRLRGGEACPICLEGKPRGVVAELEASYVTTQPDQPVRGYSCLWLKRHAVEIHDLEEAEASALMRDMRALSAALQGVTGAVKLNQEIHGNTIPRVHVHFFPRYAGDRFEDGPIDLREPWPPALALAEFDGFVAKLRKALGEA